MLEKYVFLVRTENGIEVTFKKPDGVKISSKESRWIFSRPGQEDPFVEKIGSSGEFLYSDNWTGPIGVYDLSDPSHVRAFTEQLLSHYEEILSWKAHCRLREVFGQDSVIAEVNLHAAATEQRRVELTDRQSFYLSVRSIVFGSESVFNSLRDARIKKNTTA